MGWARTVIRVIGVAGLLGILVVTLIGDRHPLDAGTAAPAVARARRLDGSVAPVILARGTPVVVNVWATWCPPCLQELPGFIRASRTYEGRVAFVGLAVDSPHADVVTLAGRLGIPYEVAEIDGAVAHKWNAAALPSTYILDGNGVVQWSVRGAIDEDTLAKHLAPLLTP